MNVYRECFVMFFNLDKAIFFSNSLGCLKIWWKAAVFSIFNLSTFLMFCLEWKEGGGMMMKNYEMILGEKNKINIKKKGGRSFIIMTINGRHRLLLLLL